MNTHLLLLTAFLSQPADDPSAFIDRQLATTWQANKLTPAAKTSDHEFVRRASLDLIGRIPTRPEQVAYMTDPPEKRRRWLIDRLLQHPDYARHWANVWTDQLLGAAGEASDRTAFHGWLQEHFTKGRSHKLLAEKLLTTSGLTRDNPALHFLAVHRGQAMPEKEWGTYGQHDMFPFTGQLFRALHGTRLQCVQCHDHPFHGDLFQSHFHEMNLFFCQVRITPHVLDKKRDGEVIEDDPKFNEKMFSPYERRNGIVLFVRPKFYDQGIWNPKLKESRREFFAERFVKHPDFARAHVNFLWAHLFGHGLNETHHADDLGPHNPVVHEKILARLTADFVKSGHDSKSILYTICLSDTYGLKSVANPSNTADETARFHSRIQTRPLTRDRLAESLVVALTGEKYADRRDALRAEILKEWGPYAIAAPSHCEVASLEPERDQPMRRALWLMNSKTIHREISAPDGTVAAVLGKRGKDAEAIGVIANDLYQIALARPTSANEARRLTEPAFYSFPRRFHPKVDERFVTQYAQDIFWALLNSNEFALQH